MSFSIEEIRRVQETTGLCNLLIFGLGFDSVFWNDVNKLGSTVFLEDNRQWIDTVRKQSPNLTVYRVDYTTRVAEGSKYVDAGTWEGLRLKLPREIEELEWDELSSWTGQLATVLTVLVVFSPFIRLRHCDDHIIPTLPPH